MELLDAILQEDRSEAEPLLAGRGFRRPERAFKNLIALRSGLTPPEFGALFDSAVEALGENPDPDRALNNLERFHQASTGATSPAVLARDRPYLFALLLKVMGHSQFMADVIIRYPHYVGWLGEPETLNENLKGAQLRESLGQSLALTDEFEARQRTTIRWMRQQLIRSGARVLDEIISETEFMAELSEIAIACIEVATAESRRRLEPRFGKPMEEDEGSGGSHREAQFAVIAMGKLGGAELNFSSDIDLIFVYSGEGKTTGVTSTVDASVSGAIANHIYFQRLCEHLIEFLRSATNEGYLYRVDTRLRPDGAEGPLARSLAAFEIYYETQARAWERLALIKARAVAGDETLGREFDRMSRALCFDARPGPDLIHHVRDLKRRIDQSVAQGDEADREIKRGTGGIREIEFLVQTLQLLHGASRAPLQTRKTLEAVDAMTDFGRFDPDQAEQIKEDYLFLRRLEHRLQMMELRQTHTIPSDPVELEAVARRCGFRSSADRSAGEQLMERWRETSDRVSKRFRAFFGEIGDEDSDGDGRRPSEQAAQAILNDHSERDVIGLLTSLGLGSSGPIQTLRRLAGRAGSRYLDNRGQELIERILPDIIEAASTAPRPAAALGHLESFLSASGSITSLYEIFASNSNIARLLLQAFGLSNTWAQTLIAHPEYVDYLLDPQFMASPPTKQSVLARLDEWAPVDAGADAESFAAAAGRLKRFHFMIAGLAETAGLIDFGQTTARLSSLADAMLEGALGRIAKLEGLEWSPDESVKGFAVLAMGKQGTKELNYFSDLDLIFCWDDRAGSGSGLSDARASKIAAWILGAMTTVTSEGAGFEVDARLRPEGKNAPLCPSYSRYLDYYGDRAELWEFQSLMKIRPVAGDPDLGRDLVGRLCQVVAGRLAKMDPVTEIAEPIVRMRRRIEEAVKTPQWVLCDFKKGSGGVIDLEFVAQMMQLRHLKDHRDVVGLRPDEVFERMNSLGELSDAEAAAMQNDYRFLRRLESRARLLFETDRSHAPAGGEKLESLQRATADLLAESDGPLSDVLLQTLARNRNRFKDFLESD